jgi:hypothetical protein
MAKSAQHYIVRLHEYNSRRDIVRQRIAKDRIILNRLTKKIKGYKQGLRVVKKNLERVKQVDIKISGFTGVMAKGSSYNPKSKQRDLSRDILCKYGIENGINGTIIARYLGYSSGRPALKRRLFTRSFATSDNNREMWQRFKLFLTERT